jgi:hypothetical protein
VAPNLVVELRPLVVVVELVRLALLAHQALAVRVAMVVLPLLLELQ